jgi:hypothetical protein
VTEPQPDPLDALDWDELDEEQLEELWHLTWHCKGRGPSYYVNQKRPFTSRSTDQKPAT